MARGLLFRFLGPCAMGNVKGKGSVPLGPLTPRQVELIRLIQGLAPDARHTIQIVCRGSEPWEVQEVIEHRRIGDVKPAED